MEEVQNRVYSGRVIPVNYLLLKGLRTGGMGRDKEKSVVNSRRSGDIPDY